MTDGNTQQDGTEGSFNINLGGLLSGLTGGGKKTTNNVEGMLGGLSDLVRSLSELAEKGHEMKKSGLHEQDKATIHYGFSISSMGQKQSGGDAPFQVKEYGNVKRDENTGEAVVTDAREPIVDVIAESDATVILAEMPGVGPDDLVMTACEEGVTLEAAAGPRRYRTTVALDHAFDPDGATVTCRNGIVEVRCATSDGGAG